MRLLIKSLKMNWIMLFILAFQGLIKAEIIMTLFESLKAYFFEIAIICRFVVFGHLSLSIAKRLLHFF
jgi:hypothetical protein